MNTYTVRLIGPDRILAVEVSFTAPNWYDAEHISRVFATALPRSLGWDVALTLVSLIEQT